MRRRASGVLRLAAESPDACEADPDDGREAGEAPEHTGDEQRVSPVIEAPLRGRSEAPRPADSRDVEHRLRRRVDGRATQLAALADVIAAPAVKGAAVVPDHEV